MDDAQQVIRERLDRRERMSVMVSVTRRRWGSREYLPHWDLGERPVMVGYHVDGSVPAALLERWFEELAHLPAGERSMQIRQQIEKYLDAGHGPTWLRNPEIASMVEDTFLHFDGARYRLHAWVVMPNHVHVLFTPLEEHALSSIMHSWKRHSGRVANLQLQRTGAFWQRDCFDRTIRDERHFAAAMAYIENNPVKAGLCARPEEWPFGSARRRRGD